MQSIEIMNGRGGLPALVQRRHDLSGVDYEHIVRIERNLAAALDDRGVCVWSRDASLAQGRPALVLMPDGAASDLKVGIEIRADGADPTTVMATAEIGVLDARCCVPPGETRDISWIHRPAAVA